MIGKKIKKANSQNKNNNWKASKTGRAESAQDGKKGLRASNQNSALNKCAVKND